MTVSTDFIPFLRPSFPAPSAWLPYLEESYAAAWFSNGGPLYKRFCSQITDRYCADGYEAVILSNATAAMTAVLMAHGVKGRVVVPSFTFPATIHSVIAAHCTPVLCDVDERTWEIDLEHLGQLLEAGDIDAVVAVRVFGFVRDYEALSTLCARYSCPLLIDSAASFGHPDRKGSIGQHGNETEVFSLHVTKVFGIGEGGMVICPTPIARELERVSNFGFHPDRTFGDGMNAKIDEVRCAIALAVLDTIDESVLRRCAVADRLTDAASEYEGLVALSVDVGPTPWQTFPILLPSADTRTEIADRLQELGIGTRPYYAPSLTCGYHGSLTLKFEPGTTPVAEDLAERMLCLPVYQGLTSEEVERVATAINTVLGELSDHSNLERLALTG